MTKDYITLARGAKNITGQRFGRLIALGPVGRDPWGSILWLCQCDCSEKTRVSSGKLRSGHTRSCGCLNREINGLRGREQLMTHGMSYAAEYQIWGGMKARCTNPNYEAWHNYGGRGIQVCNRWIESFEAFFEDMGPRPSHRHTLDRVDNNGDYTPENCRWATQRQQQNNSRRNRIVGFRGEERTLAQWSRKTGISHGTLSERLKRGWSVRRTLTTPARGQLKLVEEPA